MPVVHRSLSLATSLVLFGTGCPSAPPDGNGIANTAPGHEAGAAGSRGNDGGSPAPESESPPIEQGPPGMAAVGPASCGLVIGDIALYQGVKTLLVKDGAEVRPRSLDVVQGRQALLRVFLETTSAHVPGPVSAKLTISSRAGQKVLVDERKIAGSSTDAALESTLNFDLPAELLGEGVSYAVELVTPAPCAAVRFPAAGAAALGARRVGALRIKLVPIRFTADGSDRLPDTSEQQLAAMQARLEAMFPVETVELSLHDPVRTSIRVTGAPETWEALLDSIRDLRAAENPAPDVYYYGLISPASDLATYCPDQCYLGLSFRTDKPAAKYQAGVGLGFPELATSVLAHELGHMAGRKHSPCKVSSYIDPQYPQPQGKTGSWGWDHRSRTLHAPETSDLMGYCSPAWISDYTYRAILDRLSEVMGGNKKASLDDTRWRTLLLGSSAPRWGLPATGEGEGATEVAVIRDESGAVVTQVEVRRMELGEGEGATVMVPEPQAGWSTIEVAGAPPVRFDLPGSVPALER